MAGHKKRLGEKRMAQFGIAVLDKGLPLPARHALI
jgi:hypothetical protein